MTTTNGHMDDERRKDLDTLDRMITNSIGTTSPEIPVEVAREAGNAAHDAVASACHTAALMREMGAHAVEVAQIYKAELDAYALDIENRARYAHEFNLLMAAANTKNRDLCKEMQAKVASLELPSARKV